MRQQAREFTHSEMETMLTAALDVALAHEDADEFLAWCRTELPYHFAAVRETANENGEDAARLGLILGRAIWNALPLPGNGLRPRPLPEPSRNEPCFCGSGRKYKRCCAKAPPVPPFDRDMMLALVLPRMPKATLDEMSKGRRLPVGALAELAEDVMSEGQFKKATSYLEPLFQGDIRKPDVDYDHALYLLCDCYDALGWHKKKIALLRDVVNHLPRSILRSGAWQRLATMRMDDGDSQGAWQAFQHAQKDAPDSPAIGLLEVQLHMASGDVQQAQDRAAFWVKRLRRWGLEDDNPAATYLRAMADDPRQAMTEVGLQMAEGAGAGLRDWLGRVQQRPLPVGYTIQDGGAEDETLDDRQLLARIKGMGVPGVAAEELLATLKEQGADQVLPSGEESFSEPSFQVLMPPAALRTLSADWRLVFPLSKPFSVQNEGFDDADAWDPEVEANWTAFLDNHPEAFDSLDILDDLATAVFDHPQLGAGWVEQTLLRPVLDRSKDILHDVLARGDHVELPWPHTDNRPALRSLARRVLLDLRQGQTARAMDAAERLLEINPSDNHGFRDLLANYWLQQGEDEQVIALAERYPEDVQPELAYGKALAFYRQNRMSDANRALNEAIEILPRVAHFLTRARVRKPRMDPHGIRVGGDDQAWLYRDEMRDTWLATPGAFDWLKKAAKRHNEQR